MTKAWTLEALLRIIRRRQRKLIQGYVVVAEHSGDPSLAVIDQKIATVASTT